MKNIVGFVVAPGTYIAITSSFGTANRKISDREGFVAYLCYEHHEGNQGVHHNRDNDLILKRECEKWYLKNHTLEEFIQLIGRNYIEKI